MPSMLQTMIGYGHFIVITLSCPCEDLSELYWFEGPILIVLQADEELHLRSEKLPNQTNYSCNLDIITINSFI